MLAPDSAPVTPEPFRPESLRGTGPLPSASLLGAVGHTPLLRLERVAEGLPPGSEVWAKAEFLNPTGSVKDRAALSIVRAALAGGHLEGKVLLDASSGNTAVSYAMLGARLGFAVELLVPANAHPGRLARARAYGARVVLTDPLDGTDGAQKEAKRRAAAHPERYYYPDQYNHPANPLAHYAATGPEIWEQSRGRLTHFVAGVGTGGTLTGTARFLREVAPKVRVIGVEPDGPVHGIEGLKHLPTALRPGTYDARVVDETIRLPTEVAIGLTHRLATEEGLWVGRSSGAAVAASLEVARRTPGAVVVTILPDAGNPPGGSRTEDDA